MKFIKYILCFLLLTSNIYAADYGTLTHNFQPRTLIRAAQIMQNYNDLRNMIIDGSKKVNIAQVYINDTLVIDNDLDIAGKDLTLSGNLATNGTLTNTGNVDIKGTLTVSGNTTLSTVTANTISTGYGQFEVGQDLRTSDAVQFSSVTDGTATLTSGGISGLTTVNSVTATELSQLETIGASTISATQWGYLGGFDQDLQKADAVQFSSVTDGTATLTSGGISGLTNVNSVTATELSQLETIGASTISATQWGYLGGFDQDLQKADAVQFSSITDGSITITGGNLTGATGITATSLTGTLQTAAQGNVTSLGTLTSLTVDNVTIDGTNLTTSAAEFTINGAGADKDTIVKGVGAANALFVQGSDGKVGIGTNGPDQELEVVGQLVLGSDEALSLSSATPSILIKSLGDPDLNNFRFANRGDFTTGESAGKILCGTSTTLFGAFGFEWQGALENDMDFIIDVGSGLSSEVFRLDGSTGYVGIGTPTPGYKLEVLGTSSAYGDSRWLQLLSDDTNMAAGNGGGIAFSGEAVTGSDAQTVYAAIWGEKENGTNSNQSGQLHLGTRINGGQISSDLVIDSTGKVGIGVTDPDTKLEILDTSDQLKLSYDASNYVQIGSDSSGTLQITPSDGDISIIGNATPNIFLLVDNAYHGANTILNLGAENESGTQKNYTFTLDPDTDYLDVNGATLRSSVSPIVLGEGVFVGTTTTDTNKKLDSSSNGSGSDTLYIGNTAIQMVSDLRVKKNIVNSNLNATEKLNKLRVVDFNWNDPTDTSYNNRNARGLWTGLIAQEVVKEIPTMVNAPRKKDTLEIDYNSAQRWHLDNSATVPILIKAIQELSARIEELEGRQ